jgi:hypothetical protein
MQPASDAAIAVIIPNVRKLNLGYRLRAEPTAASGAPNRASMD